MKEGIKDFGLVEKLIGPLFSPKNEFILPLEWIWGEQELAAILKRLMRANKRKWKRTGWRNELRIGPLS